MPGLLTGMYAVTGTLFSVVKRGENDGKVCPLSLRDAYKLLKYCKIQPPRYNLEAWDDMMMERDRRLTGSVRGQTVRRLPSYVHSRCSSERANYVFL